MPNDPNSPESRQIADVAINEEELIVKRPPPGSDAAGIDDLGEEGAMPAA